MTERQTGRGFIQTALGEQIKQYFTYNVNNTVASVYEAPTDAVTGTPCSLTTYSYYAGTMRVKIVKEMQSTWDTTWES
jgi:hypothetical protein